MTRLRCRSEEHTSELQSPSVISYAVFCLKKKKKNQKYTIAEMYYLTYNIYKNKLITRFLILFLFLTNSQFFYFFFFFFFFNDTPTTEIYTTEDTLSLHDALPISYDLRPSALISLILANGIITAEYVRSEEHTSELQSPSVISYAVFCLKKKK